MSHNKHSIISTVYISPSTVSFSVYTIHETSIELAGNKIIGQLKTIDMVNVFHFLKHS